MRHVPGKELSIHYTVDCDNSKIAELIKFPPETLESKLNESKDLEEQIAHKLFGAPPAEWEDQAKNTLQLRRALEYVQVSPVQHTGNRWKIEKDRGQISNMVYQMSCSIFEFTTYNHVEQKQIPDYYHVNWHVSLNVPHKPGYSSYNGKTIDCQYNKRYKDKAAAEKYIENRVAAYAHLFTEICPPVPDEYRPYFSLYDQPLPGYTIQPSEDAVLNELLQFVSADDLTNDAPDVPPNAPPPVMTITLLKSKKPTHRNRDAR